MRQMLFDFNKPTKKRGLYPTHDMEYGPLNKEMNNKPTLSQKHFKVKHIRDILHGFVQR